MPIWSERLVRDMTRMPGADHSYLKQVCAPDGDEVRSALRAAVERIGPVYAERARDLLSSLDNRRFFQGYAEVVTLGMLAGQGWKLRGLVGAGPRIEMERPDGRLSVVSVVSFLHQTRPGGDEQTRQRLVEALSRVASRHRFVVLIRRWLPHDLDPEPVRRALEMWLGQVGSGAWEGRYAAYEDERVALEFCLTGEKAKGRQSPLAFALGPFVAHRAMEVLEPRVVNELDRHVAGPARELPLLVACVSDQPWSINHGYLRDFLYGRPSSTMTADGVTEYEFGEQGGPCAFQDPLYRTFSGLTLVDRDPASPLEARVQALLNPWAGAPLRPSDLGVRSFASAGGAAPPVLRWYVEGGEALPLG